MSKKERIRLETDMTEHPNDMLVGARMNRLKVLERRQPITLVIGEAMLAVAGVLGVYASRSADVAIFCGAVYSRDGWSGWHTYDASFTGIEEHEFFAAPRVLGQAILNARLGIKASVYRVGSENFVPYGPISGQFVATEKDIPIKDEYRVDIFDMRRHVFNSAYLARGDAPRPRAIEPVMQEFDEDYLVSLSHKSPIGFEGKNAVQTAEQLRRWPFVDGSDMSSLILEQIF